MKGFEKLLDSVSPGAGRASAEARREPQQSGTVQGDHGGAQAHLLLPLYSVMLAYNTTSLDYLSLDITSELQDELVLDTIPWDVIRIEVLAIHWASHHSEMETHVVKLLKDAANLYSFGSSRFRSTRKCPITRARSIVAWNLTDAPDL
ncbi:unnamed protein product [Trichogramma brassicae]|uniref:Uncharacterized protein n=1 Tax=Trichogramma brassicae TaxID=86971 RepID=A0A6H5I7B1_9HYME|nr:unnamed protein product [Trichogramma brassicae]